MRIEDHFVDPTPAAECLHRPITRSTRPRGQPCSSTCDSTGAERCSTSRRAFRTSCGSCTWAATIRSDRVEAVATARPEQPCRRLRATDMLGE